MGREQRMTLSNNAEMREALESCLDFIMRLDRAFNPFMQNLLENAVAKAKTALATSPRQCDVGTADEQAERFETECKRHDHCTPCLVHAVWGEFREGKPKSCQLIWAQMPYKEEGVK